MNIKLFICIVVVSILNTSLIAAQEHKWYFGGGIGVTEIESDIVLYDLLIPDHLDHSERDLGYKIFSGYKLNDYFSIELSYIDFGTMEVTASSDSFIQSEGVVWEFTQDNSTLAVDVNSIAVGLNLFFPFKKITDIKYLKSVTPFFKFGAHYWDVDKSLSPVDSVNYYEIPPNVVPNPPNPTDHNLEGDSDISWFYGAGLSFDINKRFAVFLGYEWYHLQENMVDDIDLISSCVVIKF